MTEKFATAGEISVSITDQSLRSARSTIESELGDVEVDVASQASGGGRQARTDGGVSSMLTGGAGPTAVLEDSMNELVELATERNVVLSEMLDANEREAATGDGGGGGMVSSLLAATGVRSLLGGLSAGSLFTAVSAGAIITSVSAAAIITGVAAPALIGETDAAKLIGGVSLTALVSGVGLSQLVTGVSAGAVLTTVGAATLITGVSAAAIIKMVRADTIVGKVSAAAVLGTVSAGAVLAGVSASTVIGSVGLGAIVAGTVLMNERVEGKVFLGDYLTGSDMAGEGTGVSEDASERVDDEIRDDFYEGPNRVPEDERIIGNEDALNRIRENELTNGEGGSGTGTNQSTQSGRSGGDNKNAARDRSSKTTINHNPTFKLDVSELKRKMDRDRRELERRINQLEQQIRGG